MMCCRTACVSFRLAKEKIEKRSDRIGSIYTKARYRGFTDGTFTQPTYVPEWTGFLGPPIKAETGDMVFVHFENRASGSNFSIHPHGFQYEKTSEGALYIDGTSGNDKVDDSIPQGGSITYVWNASLFHTPTNDDDNCAAFSYHSHTRAPMDIDSGLIGIGLFCRPGTLDVAGQRMDVQQEFFLYTDVSDEGKSWYTDRNLQRCGSTCETLHEEEDDDFAESNRMAHFNGFSYGNLPDFDTCPGTKVVWYFMTLNLGIHAVHANGQTMVMEGKRTDTAIIHSSTVYSGYMKPFQPGRWLLYCRNQNYYEGGILAFLNVKSCGTGQLGLPLSPRLPTYSGYQWSPVVPSTHTFTRYYYLAIEEVLWNYAPDVTSDTVV